MNASEIAQTTKFILSDLISQSPLRIDFSDDPKNNLIRINRVLLRNKIARVIWITYISIVSLILFWLTVASIYSPKGFDLSLFGCWFVYFVLFPFRPKKINAGFVKGLENVLLVRELFSSTAILKQYWNAVVEEKRSLHELEIVAAQKSLEKILSSQKIS